jgi:hypothetical protein
MDELFNYQPLIKALLEKGIGEDQIPNVINQMLYNMACMRTNESLQPIAEAWGLSLDLLKDYINYKNAL